MTTMDTSITKKQFTTLVLIGCSILALFAVVFLWLHYHLRASGNDGGEMVLALSPYWLYPYLIVSSVYVGYFAERVAQGKWKHAWLWGSAGFTLTLLFIIGIPSLISPVFPNQSPEIFAGPAILAFAAPVLSALVVALLISIHRKQTVDG